MALICSAMLFQGMCQGRSKINFTFLRFLSSMHALANGKIGNERGNLSV